MSIIKELKTAGLLSVEQDFVANTHYECVTGSVSYNCSTEASDTDVIGICTPPLEWVFPHVSGYVPGFGPSPPKFETTQQHHIDYNDSQYDVAVYSIVKFFQLAAENNPNILDVLFSPEHCIIHIDNVGKIMRDNRHLFLSKHCKFKLSGYAHGQLKKMQGNSEKGKASRMHLIDKFGFDVKSASHVVRLGLQAEQILTEQDLDLTRNAKILSDIRSGEWTMQQIVGWFTEHEKRLDALYESSTLKHGVDYDKIRQVLLDCLEEHFGKFKHTIGMNI